ncbi:hypothetical protein HDV00_009783, partial [Rhizophlyctis rosea]
MSEKKGKRQPAPVARIAKRIRVAETKPDESKIFFRKDYFGSDQVMEWTLEDYMKKHRDYPHLCEFVGMCHDPVVPYADFDMKWDKKEDLPSAEETEQIYQCVIDSFKSLFLNRNVKILTAIRPPGLAVKKGKIGTWKISLRLWARGLITTRKDLSDMLSGYFPDMEAFPRVLKEYGFDGSFFDPSVYGDDRKMNCVGKSKTNDDPRVLNPLTPAPLMDFLIQNVVNTDEKVKWSIEKPTKPKPAAAKVISRKKAPSTKFDVLNKLLNLDCDWQMEKGSDGSYQLIPDTAQCLVDPQHDHTGKSHSCLYIKKKCATLTCFSHGKRTLPADEAKEIVKAFKETFSGESKDSENIYVRLRNDLLQIAGSNDYRRDKLGNVWRPIEDLNYAYELYKEPKDFLNEIFPDNDDFSENPDNIDKLTKFMKNYDRSEFPFMRKDRHLLGFKNGVLNIVTCEFTLKDSVEDGITVRKYFDHVLDVNDTDTPLFDKILKLQFPDDEEGGDHHGVYDFILMSLGRLFFEVGERDNWSYMLYLLGAPGTGRSSIMNVVQRFFDHVGTIGAAHEKTFGLAALYDKEVIVIDDLPVNFSTVFPQTDFQSMVSGGATSIRPMRDTAFLKMWKVPLLFGGNWSLDYLDKGQITRRVVNAVFEEIVLKPDPTLERRILQSELAKLIFKCLRLYKQYVERYENLDVWKFAPAYFSETQREMRAERNPLFRFLTQSNRFEEKEGSYVLETDVKKAFEEYLRKPCGKLDAQTFSQANPKWRVVQRKICKHCNGDHRKDCCADYQRRDRTSGPKEIMN